MSATAASVAAGASLEVTDTVANRGTKKAGRFHVAYWLSRNAVRDRNDVALGRRTVKALRSKRRAPGAVTLLVPASTAAGAYRLIACADTSKKVTERNERNNCRWSRGRVAVTAASGPGGPGTPTPTPSAPSTPTPSPAGFPRPANPLTVTPTLDTAHAASSTVYTFGGSVTTTGADGTTFTLSVPGGALVAPERVTLTPVTTVGGSPLSGLVGAVEISPDGLQLVKPATLTIEPPAEAPVAQQTGFMFHGGGTDFHLYPLGSQRTLTLQLTHFSTPGVATATDAERAAALTREPSRTRAQYEQAVSELLRVARADALNGGSAPMPTAQLVDLLAGYYQDIVAPLVEQAKHDDSVATEAVSELLSWARNVQLLGLENDPRLKAWSDAVIENLLAIIRNAIAQGYDRCVSDHELPEIVRLITLARIAALLGADMSEDAIDKARRCANFEVRFDSHIGEHDGWVAGDGRTSQTDGAWRVAADVAIDWNGLGEAPLAWTSFSYSSVQTYPCSDPGLPDVRSETTGASTVPGVLKVILTMDLNPREPGGPPPIESVALRLVDFGGVAENYHFHQFNECGTPPPDEDTQEDGWLTRFNSYHLSESHVIRGWQAGTGDLIATRSYNQSNAVTGGTEQTTFEIWHKPL